MAASQVRHHGAAGPETAALPISTQATDRYAVVVYKVDRLDKITG